MKVTIIATGFAKKDDPKVQRHVAPTSAVGGKTQTQSAAKPEPRVQERKPEPVKEEEPFVGDDIYASQRSASQQQPVEKEKDFVSSGGDDVLSDDDFDDLMNILRKTRNNGGGNNGGRRY